LTQQKEEETMKEGEEKEIKKEQNRDQEKR
jgi:hypothetical protein